MSNRRKAPSVPQQLDTRPLAPLLAVLGPHALVVVGGIVSANIAVATGANALGTYGFTLSALLIYIGLARQKRA